MPDDWGGDTIFVDVSALTKQGVDKLLEMILLQAELLELKANPNRRAKGNVIESGVGTGRPDSHRAGAQRDAESGRHHFVRPVLRPGPGVDQRRGQTPQGSRAVGGGEGPGPERRARAGQEFSVVEDEKAARELAEQRFLEAKALGQETRAKVTLENLFATLAATQSKVLKVVVKADMQGSVEAIVDALKKIESDKVSLEVIHSDVAPSRKTTCPWPRPRRRSSWVSTRAWTDGGAKRPSSEGCRSSCTRSFMS